MKKALVVMAVAYASWWCFFQRVPELTDQSIREFYHEVQHATFSRKPSNLCGLLSGFYQSSIEVEVEGQTETVIQNKDQACQRFKELYADWDRVGERRGGTLFLGLNYRIHNIEIADDRKQATVDFESSLDVGGHYMNFKSHTTDTLILEYGSVKFYSTEGHSSIEGVFLDWR